MKKIWINILILTIPVILGSCKKYLDEKPSQSLYTPSNFEDLQALLDKSGASNTGPYGTSLCELVADDYYVSYDVWESSEFDQRQNYVWAAEAYDINNWSEPYTRVIYNCNVVLDELTRTKKMANNVVLEQNIEGSALLFRALAFYQLAQVYCRPYSSTASSDLGIVLRLTADVEGKSTRASVSETYTKILEDLKRAFDLLPKESTYVTRPTKAAALALLARVYLSMRDYENALKYAELTLEMRNDLMDFNNLVLTNSPVLPAYNANPEIVLLTSLNYSFLTLNFFAKIDSTLYQSYRSDDLRKKVYFSENSGTDAGTYNFSGSYYQQGGLSFVFIGPSSAEMYLIKAECLARRNNVAEAMLTLNTLLKKRYNKNTFIDLSATNATEAKNIILSERRKELIFRGQRWSDLRRLNLEGANISLKRVLNGITYTLPANDSRWVMLIPNEEIDRSGIQQNPR